ncbi:hypothetical protein DPMN_001467 [Dreissena polymorpha]|uniref:Uncharacterized protein n=1 Tax=Dreissena polymorpha TaxID=45954 RepID=A0A9D4RT29_DREPO|nr:hypothetical protein DPMN_001467 [Dreissena polymorpha]
MASFVGFFLKEVRIFSPDDAESFNLVSPDPEVNFNPRSYRLSLPGRSGTTATTTVSGSHSAVPKHHTRDRDSRQRGRGNTERLTRVNAAPGTKYLSLFVNSRDDEWSAHDL